MLVPLFERARMIRAAEIRRCAISLIKDRLFFFKINVYASQACSHQLVYGVVCGVGRAIKESV